MYTLKHYNHFLQRTFCLWKRRVQQDLTVPHFFQTWTYVFYKLSSMSATFIDRLTTVLKMHDLDLWTVALVHMHPLSILSYFLQGKKQNYVTNSSSFLILKLYSVKDPELLPPPASTCRYSFPYVAMLYILFTHLNTTSLRRVPKHSWKATYNGSKLRF